MKLKLEETLTSKTIKNSGMSIPSSLSPSKMFAQEPENYCFQESYSESTLMEMWNQQHPLIHTWMILSSISICFLSALLFIIH